jgi:hypothetical protein
LTAFDGLRVVDVSQGLAGPMAAMLLADFGAEVIKVEPPEGEMMRGIGPARHPGMAAYFLNVNRNKKSVVLDLKRRRPARRCCGWPKPPMCWCTTCGRARPSGSASIMPRSPGAIRGSSMRRPAVIARTGRSATAPPSTT